MDALDWVSAPNFAPAPHLRKVFSYLLLSKRVGEGELDELLIPASLEIGDGRINIHRVGPLILEHRFHDYNEDHKTCEC